MWFYPTHNTQTNIEHLCRCICRIAFRCSTLFFGLPLLLLLLLSSVYFTRTGAPLVCSCSSLIIGSCTCVLWLTYWLYISLALALLMQQPAIKLKLKWALLICVDKTEIFFNTSLLVFLPSFDSVGLNLKPLNGRVFVYMWDCGAFRFTRSLNGFYTP